jgi:formate-dependent nitrite reductase cytochrome c552 subunit
VSFVYPNSNALSPEKIKTQSSEYRDYMLGISRQLGITCTSCHSLDNFAKSDMPLFKKAKDHIRITQILIDSGMNGTAGNPKADCFLCHRGKLKPDYTEGPIKNSNKSDNH